MASIRLFLERRLVVLSLTAVVLFTALFSTLSVFSARELNKGLHLLLNHPVRVTEAIFTTRLALAEMEIRMGRLVQYNRAEDAAIVRRSVEAARKDVESALHVMAESYLGPVEQVARLRQILSELYVVQNGIVDAAPGLDRTEIARREDAELEPLYRDIDDLLGNTMLRFINSTSERQAARSLNTLRTTIVFSALGVLLTIALALVVRRFAERRAAEREFRDYVLKIISENAGNVFLIYNLKTRALEYVSPNAATVLGLEPARLGAEPAGLLVLLDAPQAEELRPVLGSEVFQTRYERECRVRHAVTGEKKWMLFSLVPVREQDVVSRYVISLADLTEVQKTQQVLRDALLSAQSANTAKTEFLSRMSHEIRTPMNAIIGMTTIAATVLDDRSRMEDCLTKIAFSSRHLLMLINDVLDMSKIENGKLSLVNEPFVLPEFIRGLTDIVYPQSQARKIDFEVVIGDISHEVLKGDALRLSQVLLNLLSNALKFTPEGGTVRLHIRQLPDKREDRVRLRLTVSDSGRGMSEEFLSRVFIPFEQEGGGRSSQAGTGLGLAITKNIVSLMNGTIRVRSALGRGTVFTVDLALDTAGERTARKVAFDSLRVLVVDDDKDACEHASIILERMGIRAVWALSGREAVDRALTAHRADDGFHVVFMDWKMPDMDGIEATRRIRRQVGPETLIIIISAYDWSEIEQEARRAGANAFISKPMFPSTIYNTLLSVTHDPTRLTVPASSEPQGTEDAAVDFSGCRFLVVEDNALNMEIAVVFLEQAGARVDRAFNGQEAVEKFAVSAEGYYDVIIMDVQMPIMDGHEATRAIRSMDRPDAVTVPVIAMTANAFAEDVSAALDAGMNVHVAKPIDRKLLLRTIENQLARRYAA